MSNAVLRLICAGMIVAMGCIDDYPLDIPFEGPQLVADVLISSEHGRSRMIVGWTYPAGEGCRYEDDFGTIWIPCSPDESTGPYKVTGTIALTDTHSGERMEYPLNMADRKGFIVVDPQMTGIPGRIYRMEMEITYGGETQTYEAETKMIPTPEITSMGYVIRKGDVGKEDNFVPLVSFHEPKEERNFYLFQLCSVNSFGETLWCGNSRVWPYSVISDETLPESVEGLSIDDGATVAKYAQFYPQVSAGEGAQVRMYSIDETVYGFYKNLLEQFNSDGGAYTPTPATPPGNIPGVIGLFRALDESSGVVYAD